MDGMVNTCELSINVVMSNKPKMLTGLSQKALERVQGLDNILSWTPNAPGGQRAPNPFVSTEGRPVMGWIRVAPVVRATSPAAQAGRLPYGVSARESRRNRHRRCCK